MSCHVPPASVAPEALAEHAAGFRHRSSGPAPDDIPMALGDVCLSEVGPYLRLGPNDWNGALERSWH
jgi:hypothetical protein